MPIPKRRGAYLDGSAPPQGYKTSEQHLGVLEMLKGNRPLMEQALRPTMSAKLPIYFGDLVSDALAMDKRAFRGNALALEHYNLTHKLKSVFCPVLVIQGLQDYLISKDMAEATARAFPRSRLELLHGIGHSPHIEAPEVFYKLLSSFLNAFPL
ncbi:MAG: alpha/beta hydrolase [Deinococcales bacterium]